MTKNDSILGDIIQLARIALTGRQQDVHLLLYKLSKKYKDSYPDFAIALIELLQEAPTRSSPLRKQVDTPLPVDIDSRLKLLRVENANLEHEIVLPKSIQDKLNQLISERTKIQSLIRFGLQPTKSVLFTGPPGVGKTMTARWIAHKLNKPLLILDLAAVMSSFLGRTGNNVRHVLDYAKSIDCVLLLDELDAIAKRRDDNGEIGELKRLVTVLLQEIDDWPSSGLLIAATNHPDLLDPAVWRRFELVISFPKPEVDQIEKLVDALLSNHLIDYKLWSKVLSLALKGNTYSDIERKITLVRRASVLDERPLAEYLETLISSENLSHSDRVELARALFESRIVSQRRAHELTGVARETIRKIPLKTISKSNKN